MMYDEPQVMKDLHALRERLAAEEKDLTPQELCAKLNEHGRRLAAELGLKVRKSSRPSAK
jgi:methionyl-tRNA synthetase